MDVLKKKMIDFLIVLGLVYVFVLVLMTVFQRNFQYFPDTSRPNPVHWQAEDRTVVNVTTKDDIALQGWWWPPQSDDKPVLVHFHGNGGNIGSRAWLMRPLIAEGYGLLLAEYRGYGGNSGKPTEQGFYNDARAYIQWLIYEQNLSLSRTIFHGESIGSGPAVQMATEYDVRAVILEAPFTTIPDVARRIYFFLPVDLLMKDQYRNIDKITQINADLLVIHGGRDQVVPFELGKKLYDAASEPKTFVQLDGADHINLYQMGAVPHIIYFLESFDFSNDMNNENKE